MTDDATNDRSATEPTTHHVGVTVADLERAVTFYRHVLGLDVLDRFSVDGEAFATGVDVPDASAKFAHLDGDGVRVELVSYEPAGEDRAAPDLNQAGAAHLALSVDDLDAFYRGLPDDVTTLSEPQTTASGTRICFVRDPEDNLIEVLEV